jgi:putative ABC transport system permease protein
MIGGYATSLYFITSNVLDVRLQLLLLSPLAVLGAVCLLIAATLLFLRFLPRLLALGSRLAARRRGAAPLLAIAQMARAPRQPLRMTLLLALATAFAVFSLVFLSSQAQRVVDVAAYTGGADFSGPLAITDSGSSLDPLTRQYASIHGVLNASLGFATTAVGPQNLLIALRAVDTRTFFQASIWSQEDTDQPPDQLIRELGARQSWGEAHHVVPAIIDDAAAQSLHLGSGSTFVLSVVASSASPAISTPFIVLAQVHHIPSIVSSAQAPSTPGSSIPLGGVLVDYQTYASVFAAPAFAAGSDLPPLNYVWLHTQSTPSALTSVRLALSNGDLQLTQVIDRHALLQALQYEPLYLDLIGILLTGTATALLLALAGNVLTSWQSARSRLLNFAVLRALGSSRPQIAAMLFWEQGLTYAAAMALGMLFGAILSWLVVPALVFTGVPSSGFGSDTDSSAFYISQSVPPVQVVFPPWLILLILALLGLSALALWLMISLVTRRLPGQFLRMNED